MTMRKGLPAKLAATDADDTRYDFKNLIVCNADGSPRGGVTSPVGTNIVSSTATMNVSVSAFAAAAARDGGAILLANDGPTNVLIGTAPVANQRIDVVYAKQNDASSTVTSPDANNNPVLGVSQGVASATPIKPSIPVGAVELASILIPSGATSTNAVGVVIAQTTQFTAAPGAPVPFRTASDRDAWTTAGASALAWVFSDGTTANNGRYAFVPSSGKWVRRDGGRIGRARMATPTVIAAAAPSWFDLLTITTDSSGLTCAVDVVANVYNPNSGAARIANLRVTCDGVQVEDAWTVDVPLISGVSSAGVTAVVRGESAPAAGSHVWKLQANAGATSGSVSIRTAVLSVSEV